MKPIFICLVAWEDGNDSSNQTYRFSSSNLARAGDRAKALRAANSSIVGSIAAALLPIFSPRAARSKQLS